MKEDIISVFDPGQNRTRPRWVMVNGNIRWIVGIDTTGRTIYETRDRQFSPVYPSDRLEEFPSARVERQSYRYDDDCWCPVE
jgi:hypothetical protein